MQPLVHAGDRSEEKKTEINSVMLLHWEAKSGIYISRKVGRPVKPMSRRARRGATYAKGQGDIGRA